VGFFAADIGRAIADWSRQDVPREKWSGATSKCTDLSISKILYSITAPSERIKQGFGISEPRPGRSRSQFTIETIVLRRSRCRFNEQGFGRFRTATEAVTVPVYDRDDRSPSLALPLQ
jgi:hypothetical protein